MKPDPRERATEILRGPEGERIYLLLLDHADKIARLHGWKTGRSLPGSSDPSSIANETIVKVLDGQRNWDRETEPDLLIALKGMVRSEISHLFEKKEFQQTEPIDRLFPDGTERTADSFASPHLTPEQNLIAAEQSSHEMVALELILREVEGDEDLESVFLALYETDNLQQVAKVTGLSIDRVYSCQRQLDRIASRITPERVARVAKEKARESL